METVTTYGLIPCAVIGDAIDKNGYNTASERVILLLMLTSASIVQSVKLGRLTMSVYLRCTEGLNDWDTGFLVYCLR